MRSLFQLLNPYLFNPDKHFFLVCGPGDTSLLTFPLLSSLIQSSFVSHPPLLVSASVPAVLRVLSMNSATASTTPSCSIWMASAMVV